MSTREEIEAAVDVVRRYNGVRESSPYVIADEFGQPSIIAAIDLVNRSQETLADAYLAERQQRERDQQPPTREMFERLKIMHLFCGANISGEHSEDWTTWGGHAFCKIDTIAKLRAACLLLGINTEGIL